MDEPPPLTPEPLTPPSQPVEAPAPSMSLGARLLNVFAMPGEVFEDVRRSGPRALNWVVPGLLLSVLTALLAMVIFAQPALRQQMKERTDKAFEEKVKSGKMTQADAERAQAMAEKFMGPAFMTVMGIFSGVMSSFLRILWWALVLWVMGRWLLRAQFSYRKTLEVVGLAMMVSALGTLVTLLLTVNMSRMVATPSLALLVSDFDVKRKSHVVLRAMDVFIFWLLALLSIGLSRLAGVPFLRAAFPVAGYWLVQLSLVTFSGLAQFGF